MVESAFTTMPRACRASRISLSVIPGWFVAIARSVSACGSRIGRRWPPIFAGAVLLYVSGLSMNRTAQLLGVSTPTIQAWLEQFAQAYAQKPEPEGREIGRAHV